MTAQTRTVKFIFDLFFQLIPQFHKNVSRRNRDEVATQLVLASATMPTNISESLQLIIDTQTIHEAVSPYLHKVMPNITQKFIRMRKAQRPLELLELVRKDLDKKRPIIVFSNKKATSDFVSMFLNDHDIDAVSMNNAILEKIRQQQFKKFQSGQVNILSTTDLASRGLDTKRVRILSTNGRGKSLISLIDIVLGLSRDQF